MNSQPENQPKPSENPSDVLTKVPEPGSSSGSELTEAQLEETIKSALKLLSKDSFEEACSTLEETLQKAKKVYGESSFEAARLHFELGNALLQKVETSSIQTGEKEDKKENETDEANEEESEEEVDDMQAAWEQLEIARVYMEKLLKAQEVTDPKLEENKSEENKNTKISRTLAQVMVRLGDANCFNENFDGAIADYEKGLQLRKEIEDKSFSRGLAETYFLLGSANLYKNGDNCDEVALDKFNRARIILENVLYKLMGSNVSKDPEDSEAHKAFLSKEFLKPNIFETDKIKDLKETLGDLYNRIEDINEKKKEKESKADE